MYLIIGIWAGRTRLRGDQVLPLHAARLAADAGRAGVPVLRVGGSFSILDWHQVRLPMVAQVLLFVAFFAASR